MSVKMRQKVEREIAVAVIKALLAAGYSLGVNDGEETTIHHSTDAKAIENAMFTTDEDWLLVFENRTPAASPHASLDAGIARGHAGHARPVQIALSVRHGGEQMVADQAGKWHRGGQLLGRLERQTDVLEPQSQCKSGGLELPVGNEPPVVGIDRRSKQSDHHLQKGVRRNVRFTQRGEGLAEGLDHRGNHEIAAQLGRIGLGRVGAQHERLPSDGVEQGPAAFHHVRRAGGNHQQILARGSFRPSENRGAQVFLPVLPMRAGHTPRQRHADGAARNVNRALRKRGDDAVFAEDHLFHRLVVGQHGHDGLRLATHARRGIRYAGAIGNQSFRLISRAIENHHLMARAKQVSRQARAHTAQSNESNPHNR